MLTAHELAHQHDQAVAALWRGDPAPVQTLTNWLARFWDETSAAEPADGPAAVSVLGGGGAGIRWYDAGTALIGFVGRVPDRCYHIPTTARLPSAGRSTRPGGRA